jgi:hypothetical protein
MFSFLFFNFLTIPLFRSVTAAIAIPMFAIPGWLLRRVTGDYQAYG